jgi:hypothetical protein
MVTNELVQEKSTSSTDVNVMEEELTVLLPKWFRQAIPTKA